MRYLTLVTVVFFIISCKSKLPTVVDNRAWSDDSLRIQHIESFINTDLEKAYHVSEIHNLYDNLNLSDIITFNYENTEPQLLYVATPDCSFCIMSALDFIAAFSQAHVRNLLPIVVLKSGDADIFEFYRRQKITDSLDRKTARFLSAFQTISSNNGALDTVQDGAYLIYRDRIVKFTPWPPQQIVPDM